MPSIPFHAVDTKGKVLGDNFAPAAAVILPANAKTLYISGVVGENEDGSFGDFRTQVFLIFDRITEILLNASPSYKSAENAWKHVFEITAYHVGSLPEHLPVELEAVDKYLKGAHPTWTSAAVEKLFHDGQLYEVHVKAIVP
ncbi:hypothetical protein I308_100092 [Cryptococcus tetragattii IND107]|uniref:Uncharacterized protein n=1 Tax=Cryptococcus tetragattii IND107 TaxID=1296105 RepID=A0ABR3C3T2_9TREE|nr:hypothetical protein I308_04418 [Cryptococcus tetragattii IND107]